MILVFPPEHAPVDVCRREDLPPEVQELVTRYRAMPGGEHTMMMYRSHRWPQAWYDGAPKGEVCVRRCAIRRCAPCTATQLLE